MERYRQDLAYGFRSLQRRPGFALVATLTLALGIGANVAMVSFAKAILMPSLPYENPDHLVVLERWSERSESDLSAAVVSLPAVIDWRERNRVCSRVSILYRDTRNLTGKDGEPERVESLLVSANLLTTLGIRPFLGRELTAADDRPGAHRAAMLSYELWQRRFGGDSGILDRSIVLDDQMYAVVGILPPGLSTESLGNTSLGDIWLPMGLFYDDLPMEDRKVADEFVTLCRLKPNVSMAAASKDMARINRELAQEYPLTDHNKNILVIPIREYLVGDLRPVVVALVVAVIFVLFIACANLVHLLLSRFMTRQQEFAIRSAMGARPKRLILQGLCEALVLALLGGLIGSLAASVLVRVLPVFLADVPYVDQARISPFIAVYALVLSLVVSVVIGIIPAMQMVSPAWQELLTGSLGSRSYPRHKRLRQAMIVGELALAVVLLTGTGMALATYLNLRGEALGYSTERILVVEVALPSSKYGDVSAWTSFFDEALGRVSALPGVETATVMNALPMAVNLIRTPAVAGDRPIPSREKWQRTYYFIVSPDFFRALDIPLIEGRYLDSRDDDRRATTRKVVISQRLARSFWPERSAVGRKVAFEFKGTMEEPKAVEREVVGVVGDAHFQKFRLAPQNAVYVSYGQRPTWEDGNTPSMALLVKTAMEEPTKLAETVRATLLEIDRNQPVHGVRPLQQIIDAELDEPRRALVLFSSFACLALLLTLAGVYGVVSYSVSTRTGEIGTRMSLGARPSQVLRDLLWEYLKLTLIGLGIGLVMAASLTRQLESHLYGVSPADPRVYLAACVVLTAASLLATLVPASQAARVDPARSLRHE